MMNAHKSSKDIGIMKMKPRRQIKDNRKDLKEFSLEFSQIEDSTLLLRFIETNFAEQAIQIVTTSTGLKVEFALPRKKTWKSATEIIQV